MEPNYVLPNEYINHSNSLLGVLRKAVLISKRYLFVFILQLLLLSTTSAQSSKIGLLGKDAKHKRFSSMAMSPDGKQVVISVDNFLFLVDMVSERVVQKISGSFTSLKYSNDGQTIFGISNFERHILDSKNLAVVVSNSDTLEPGKIGVTLEKVDGTIVITRVWAGGPVQENTKIQAGDELIGVGDGRGGRIRKISSASGAVNSLAGPASTWLRLQVLEKKSGELREYLLQRISSLEQSSTMEFRQPLPAARANSIQFYLQDKNRIGFSSIDNGEILCVFAPIDVEATVSRYGKSYVNWALNSDGSRFAILSTLRSRQGNAVEIFSTLTGQRIAFAPFIPATRASISFSEDGNKVLATSEDTLEIIDIKGQTTIARLHLRENYQEPKAPTLGFRPRMLASRMVVLRDGIVATGNQWGQIQIWNINNGDLVKTIEHDKDFAIVDLCKSQDRETLCWYSQGNLYWEKTKSLAKKKISGFEKSPSEEPKSDWTEWDQEPDFGTAELVQTFMTGPNINDYQRSTTPFLEFSQNGQRLFIGGKVGFIPSEPVRKPTGEDSISQGLAQHLASLESRLERLDGPQKFKIGGEFRASGGVHGKISNTVDVYETASGKWLHGYRCLLKNKVVECRHGAISPDEKKLAVVGGGYESRNVVQVFNNRKFDPVLSLEYRNVGGIAFLNDSERLLAFLPDKDQISLIDIVNGGLIPDSDVSVSESKFGQQFGLSLSPSGRTFALGALQFNSRNATLENSFIGKNWCALDTLDNGIAIGYQQYHGQEITLVEGDKLTPVSGDRERVFDAKFSTDGELFAVASGTKIELWDRNPLKLVTTIENAHARRVNSVSFSPAAQLLASNSQDGSTRIWDISMALKEAAASN